MLELSRCARTGTPATGFPSVDVIRPASSGESEAADTAVDIARPADSTAPPNITVRVQKRSLSTFEATIRCPFRSSQHLATIRNAALTLAATKYERTRIHLM